MWQLLQLALKGGFRTSEFWLAAAGLAVTLTAPLADQYVAQLHGVAATHTGTAALVAGIGAAVISGAYSLARAMTKTAAVKAGADTAAPSGNVMTPGPGSATLEEAHRAAVVAATDAMRVAHDALVQASNLPRPASTLQGDSLTASRASVNDVRSSAPAPAVPPKANG
jgi:hypothetical protein